MFFKTSNKTFIWLSQRSAVPNLKQVFNIFYHVTSTVVPLLVKVNLLIMPRCERGYWWKILKIPIPSLSCCLKQLKKNSEKEDNFHLCRSDFRYTDLVKYCQIIQLKRGILYLCMWIINTSSDCNKLSLRQVTFCYLIYYDI